MRGGGVGAWRPLAGSECGTDYGTPRSGPWPASYEAKRSESPDPGQNGGGVASSAQAALLRPPCVPPRARRFSTRAPAAAEDLRLPRNAALPINLARSHSPTPSPVGEVVQHLLPGAGGQVGHGQAGDGAVREHARRARHGLGAGPPPVGALPIRPRHQGGVAAAAGRGGARPREARRRAAPVQWQQRQGPCSYVSPYTAHSMPANAPGCAASRALLCPLLPPGLTARSSSRTRPGRPPQVRAPAPRCAASWGHGRAPPPSRSSQALRRAWLLPTCT